MEFGVLGMGAIWTFPEGGGRVGLVVTVPVGPPPSPTYNTNTPSSSLSLSQYPSPDACTIVVTTHAHSGFTLYCLSGGVAWELELASAVCVGVFTEGVRNSQIHKQKDKNSLILSPQVYNDFFFVMVLH